MLMGDLGGGYVLPAHTAMVEFMFQVVDFLKSHSKNDVACLFLSYDLSPGAVYPRQLQQASLLIKHITTNLNIPPSNIILTGDSAGANLAMSLLSHISHPHSSVPKVTLSEPFRGVVLISPWVSFDVTAHSFRHNQYKDCVGQAGGKKWSGAFLASTWPHEGKKDNYNEAATAPASWWIDLPVQEDGFLIVCGEEEVLRDGIVQFKDRLVQGWGKVDFLCARGEYHDQPNIDLQLGFKEKDEGEQAKLVKRWITSKL
jgi:acetyl esterase/lipase